MAREPNQRRLLIHARNRGEDNENAHIAASKKTVLGNRGTGTEIIPTPSMSQPNPMSTNRNGGEARTRLSTGRVLEGWSVIVVL